MYADWCSNRVQLITIRASTQQQWNEKNLKKQEKRNKIIPKWRPRWNRTEVCNCCLCAWATFNAKTSMRIISFPLAWRNIYEKEKTRIKSSHSFLCSISIRGKQHCCHRTLIASLRHAKKNEEKWADENTFDEILVKWKSSAMNIVDNFPFA